MTPRIAPCRALPERTRILWDDRMGGGYHQFRPWDFREAGYRPVAEKFFDVDLYRPWFCRAIRGHKPEPTTIAHREKE